jgi:probable phosphoglycerate mutase
VAVKHRSITLYLIQCGETAWQAEGRLQGAMDLPLSDAGRDSIIASLWTLEGCRASTVYHPSDEAAQSTAELCAARLSQGTTSNGNGSAGGGGGAVKTKAVAGIADPHLGIFEGLTEQDFADRFPSRYRQWRDDVISFMPPDGEEMIEAADRIFRAIAGIVRRSKDPDVPIVLHSLGLGLMRCWLGEKPLRDLRVLLAKRPRVERYEVAVELIAELESAAAAEHARS